MESMPAEVGASNQTGTDAPTVSSSDVPESGLVTFSTAKS